MVNLTGTALREWARNIVRNDSRKVLLRDPTRTTMIRRKFISEINRRFNAFAVALRKLIDDDDSFGLKPRSAMAMNEEWQALRRTEQIDQFKIWVDKQVRDGILSKTDVAAAGDTWLDQYIEESYKKGQSRSFNDVMDANKGKSLPGYMGTREQFLRSAFDRPVSVERVKLIASRSYDDLVGVTTAMSNRITRNLTDGLIQGTNPRELGRQLSKDVGIMRNRANTIARTEVIRAHADGQIQMMRDLGVTEVDAIVEWATAEDDRVCAKCAELHGVTFKMDEAEGKIPLHPNCRCAWLPAGLGETPTLSPSSILEQESGEEILFAERNDLWGHSGTSVVRWMGSEGVSYEDAQRVLQSQNVTMAESTIKANLSGGKLGTRGAIAPLTPDQIAEIRSIIAGKGIEPPIEPPIVPPPPPTVGGVPNDLWGYSQTATLRWMGKNGWTYEEAKMVLNQVGHFPAESTIRANLSGGKLGTRGAPAPLTFEQSSALTAMRTKGGVTPPIAPPVAPPVAPPLYHRPATQPTPPTPIAPPTPITPSAAASVPAHIRHPPVNQTEFTKQIWAELNANPVYMKGYEGKNLPPGVAAKSATNAVKIGKLVGAEVEKRLEQKTRALREELNRLAGEIEKAYAEARGTGRHPVEAVTFRNQRARLLSTTNQIFKDTMQEVLGEVREMGGGNKVKIVTEGKSRDRFGTITALYGIKEGEKTKDALDGALSSLPSDWNNQLVKFAGGRTVNALDAKRGYAASEILEIATSGPGDADRNRVAVHELTHMRDYASIQSNNIALAYRRQRVDRTEDANKKELRDIYGPREKGYEDEFDSHYTGKVYGSDSSEINTMAVQELLAPPGFGRAYELFMPEDLQSPAGKLLKDKELLEYAMGILVGT